MEEITNNGGHISPIKAATSDGPLSAELVARFRALFDGLPRVYGTYSTATKDERGKLTGKAVTLRATVTDALIGAHLAGEQGIGLVPIRDDATVRFGAIDIDVYAGLDASQIARTLAGEGLPLIPCLSKSGGVHIYCFTSTPVAASQMRAKLQQVASMLGYGGCEIFPKQTRLVDGECGGWINLPYFGGNNTERYAIRPDGERLTFEQFLELAERSRVEQGFFGKPLHTTLADGPPCLGHLIQIGIPAGTRNDTLFQLAVYAKRANSDGWKSVVERYNHDYFNPPLGADEVLTIMQSVGKKDYQYACNRPPLSAHCDRALCKTRRYGIGDTAESLPVLGPLVKYDSRPPRYLWEVDGQRVRLGLDELLSYPLFRRACCAQLNAILPDVKPKDWAAVLKKSMDRVHIEPVEDASPESQFWELLEKFCTWNPCESLEEVLLGRTFTEKGKTFFRLSDLRRFLTTQRFQDCSMQEIAAIMKQRGAVGEVRKLRGKSTRLWAVPEFQREDSTPYPVPRGLVEDSPF